MRADMSWTEARKRVVQWAREVRPTPLQVRDAWYSEEPGSAQDLAKAIDVLGLSDAARIATEAVS